MPGGWDWDFEEERGKRRPGQGQVPPVAAAGAGERLPPPPRPAGERSGPERTRREPGHEVRIRRRRLGGALLIGVLLAATIAALASRGGGSVSTVSLGADGRPLPHTRTHPPSEPEGDLRAAVASVLAYTPFVRHGGARGRDVALTFDDGPGPYTPQVLDVLERFHVHATFFAIGRMERYFGASTVREIEDGDVVGDHTEDHAALAHLSAHDQQEELFEQIARIELQGGPRPDLFRPPYGSFDATTIKELRSLHLLMVLWSADTGDYLQPGVAAIVQRALDGAGPGAIILLHDGGGTRTETVEALPTIIQGLRDRGYRLVTVPQLLRDDPPPAGEPLPGSLAGD